MAGGGGTRLWPASTATRPKQLMKLSSRPPHTLLAAAVERACKLTSIKQVYVVTSMALAPAVQAAVPELLRVNVIPEPRPRSTAPCLTLALLHVREDLRRQGWSETQVQRATVVVLPADHHIGDVDAFADLLRVGCEHAEEHGCIVTLGVEPRRPSTGFGYIERGPEPLARRGAAYVYPALRFVEKPDAARAQIFIDSGKFLWNAGIFVMPLARILAEIEEHAPTLWAAMRPVIDAMARGEDAWAATVAAYEQIAPEAIDVAVMEQQRDLCVVPMCVPWTDLGSWDAVHEALPRDEHGNAVVAPKTARTELLDTQGSLVWSDDLDVTLLGMTGVAVVVSGGRVLVCPLDRAEEVRRLARRS